MFANDMLLVYSFSDGPFSPISYTAAIHTDLQKTHTDVYSCPLQRSNSFHISSFPFIILDMQTYNKLML